MLRLPPRIAALGLACLAALICAICFLYLDAAAARYATGSLQNYKRVASLVTDLGLSGYMIVGSVTVVAAGYLVKRRQPHPRIARGVTTVMERAFFVGTVVVVSGILAQIIKHLVGRARPKLIDTLGATHFDAFSLKASLASFPSGHTTSAFALAAALAMMAPRLRWPLLVFALAVGTSRFVVGAHYVSDLVGGAALGLIVVVLCAGEFASRSLVFRATGRGLILKDAGTVLPMLRLAVRRLRGRP